MRNVVQARRLSHWLITISLIVICTGCGSGGSGSTATFPEPLGARLTFKKGELYFTSAITRAEADAVGHILEKQGWFDDKTSCSVQMTGTRRLYLVRLCVREGTEQKEDTLLYRKIGAAISKDAFQDVHVDVHLCDGQFNTLKVIPFNPPKPDLPVMVRFRQSIGGGSLVAQYLNGSDRFLALAVTLTNPTLNETRKVTIEIRPNSFAEHGWAEGWKYMSGEKIVLYHADYEPMTVTVP